MITLLIWLSTGNLSVILTCTVLKGH